MQAFQKSTIQDVSFAGHHISDCIPSETYSEGSALDTNVHRIIEAHRRMQHTIGLPENFCRTSGGGHSGEWRAVDERPEPGRYSASGERLGDISKYVSFSICIFTDTQIISFHVWPRCVLVHLKTKHVNEPNLDPADTVASRILWVLMVQNVSICYATPKL
jgi:hypothetical protein